MNYIPGLNASITRLLFELEQDASWPKRRAHAQEGWEYMDQAASRIAESQKLDARSIEDAIAQALRRGEVVARWPAPKRRDGAVAEFNPMLRYVGSEPEAVRGVFRVREVNAWVTNVLGSELSKSYRRNDKQKMRDTEDRLLNLFKDAGYGADPAKVPFAQRGLSCPVKAEAMASLSITNNQYDHALSELVKDKRVTRQKR